MQGFLAGVMEEGLVSDGTIAQDSTQAAAIWAIREGISVALTHAGTQACSSSSSFVFFLLSFSV
jgi:hypothetical protein